MKFFVLSMVMLLSYSALAEHSLTHDNCSVINDVKVNIAGFKSKPNDKALKPEHEKILNSKGYTTAIQEAGSVEFKGICLKASKHLTLNFITKDLADGSKEITAELRSYELKKKVCVGLDKVLKMKDESQDMLNARLEQLKSEGTLIDESFAKATEVSSPQDKNSDAAYAKAVTDLPNCKKAK